jgi:hypothetical protein
MTPLTRLIPESSGNAGDIHRTERGPIREYASSGGDGRVPPMRPSDMELAPMEDDIVSEILRDSRGQGQGQEQEDFHPSQYQEPEYDEPPSLPLPPRPMARSASPKTYVDEEEGGTDYIGLILDEIKLPLIVAFLILGASASGLDDILTRFIPALDGKSGYVGMLIKAIVGGLLFYALKRIFL